jgi:2-oxoglutarate ferredoxin oxidoreductase subunit alpha
VRSGVEAARAQGLKAAHLHLRWLNPFPANLGELLKRYDKVLVPELNLGQLWRILRATFLVDAVLFSKMQGKPFKVSEITNRIRALS